MSEFHVATSMPGFDGPDGRSPEAPTIPSDDRVRLRLRLIAEEFFETMRAALNLRLTPDLGGHHLATAERCLALAIERSAVAVDLSALVDGLADLDVVVEGTRLEFGVDGGPIAAEVHRANMDKVGGPVRADGKQLKPGGFTPANVEECLRRQGWRPR